MGEVELVSGGGCEWEWGKLRVGVGRSEVTDKVKWLCLLLISGCCLVVKSWAGRQYEIKCQVPREYSVYHMYYKPE